MAKQSDPKTPEEWQAAVDAADALISLDSARRYGLIKGGPDVNIDRCGDIVRRGAELGYKPSPAGVKWLVETYGR